MDFPTVGIYAYIEHLGKTPGGVEAQVVHVARHLALKGYSVNVHCLCNSLGGFGATGESIQYGKDMVRDVHGIIEYSPVPGPGLEGLCERNLAFSRERGEALILAFGTRDGFLFSCASQVASILNVPLVSFIYFTEEERRVRSQFGNFTRSIPCLNTLQQSMDQCCHDEEVIRTVVRTSARVIVPTHYVRAQVGALCESRYTPKIRVVYHGVDDTFFTPGHRNQGFNRPIRITQVSRLSIPYAIQKNFIWFANSILELQRRQVSGFSFRIIGPGNGIELLREFATRSLAEGLLTFSSYLSQSEIIEEYRATDVIFSPSMMEAGSTTLVEGALCGALPMALDYAGNGEILDGLGVPELGITPEVTDFGSDGAICSVVPNWDHYRELLARVESEPDWALHLRETAMKNAKARYALGPNIQRLESVLLEVL